MVAPGLWRMRPYLRPHVGRIALIIAASAGGVATAVMVPFTIRRVVDGPIADGDRSAILPLCALILVLGLAEAGAALTRRWVLSSISTSFEQAVRNDIYAHLQRLPASFHDEWQSGQLLSRAMADLSVIRRFMGFGLVIVVMNFFTLSVVLTVMATLHAGLAAIVALSLVLLGWLTVRFKRSYRMAARAVQEDQGELATVIEESAAGIRVIKAFGRGRHMEAEFLVGAEHLRSSVIKGARLRARFYPVIDIVPNLALAAVLLVGGIAVGEGGLTLGGLAAFTSLLLSLVSPIEHLGRLLADLQEAESAVTRIYEVLDTVPDIDDRPGAVALHAVTGHLRFENVGFRFGDSDRWALRGVDLELAPGETLAVVGAAGSGKTALLSLVARLYDPVEGRVTLDGHDLRDVRLDSLRRHVGVAFDEPLLFSVSVRENLLLGFPDATDEELSEAIKVAQAGFVYDLPWGLDTRVGEQGMSLSGGQRQRLALARAIVGRPGVLVLDDPLSALDIHTEHLVESALARVLSGTTAVVAVHRRSTLAHADRVALLVEGRLVAVGTHHELLRSQPVYRELMGMPDPGSVAEMPESNVDEEVA